MTSKESSLALMADSRSVTPGTKPLMVTLLIEDRRPIFSCCFVKFMKNIAKGPVDSMHAGKDGRVVLNRHGHIFIYKQYCNSIRAPKFIYIPSQAWKSSCIIDVHVEYW